MDEARGLVIHSAKVYQSCIYMHILLLFLDFSSFGRNQAFFSHNYDDPFCIGFLSFLICVFRGNQSSDKSCRESQSGTKSAGLDVCHVISLSLHFGSAVHILLHFSILLLLSFSHRRRSSGNYNWKAHRASSIQTPMGRQGREHRLLTHLDCLCCRSWEKNMSYFTIPHTNGDTLLRKSDQVWWIIDSSETTQTWSFRCLVRSRARGPSLRSL